MQDLALQPVLYRKLCRFVLFFMAAAASFNGFYQQSYFKEPGTIFYFPHASFDTIVDGTAYRPYIYRQLLPAVANWVDAHVSPQLKNTLYESKGASGLPFRSRFFNTPMAQDPHYFLLYWVLYALVFLFALIAVYALEDVGIAAGHSPMASAFAAVTLMIAFPYFGPWSMWYYDYPELAFFAIAVWIALTRDWWWLIPVAGLATLNKESFLLFVPTLYPLLRSRGSRLSALTGTAALCLVSGVFYYLVHVRFQHNPGGAVEYHFSEWLSVKNVFGKVTDIYGVPGQNLSPITILVIVWTALLGWRRMSVPIRRHAQMAAFINVPLFLMFCSPGELRDLSMLYVVFFLLITANVDSWIREQSQPLR